MKTQSSVVLALLMSAAILAVPGLVMAQIPAGDQTGQTDSTEDMADGATIVRGRYTAGDTKADWEAAVQKGKPERIAEWRDYGQNGNANVIFSFHNGDLMHYGEHGQRRGGQAGSMDGMRKVELALSFANGRYTGGKKTIDGIETEPTEAEIRGANVQALAALERLAGSKSAWQETRGSGFSMNSIPQPAPATSEARKLAGEGGEIVFRCSDTLHAVLGAAQERLVVETAGRDPVVLQRQQPGARFDYFGAGWGAERSGEEIRLQDASGRGQLCRIVSAGAPPSSVPPAQQQSGAPQSGAMEPLPAMTIPSGRN